MVEECTMPVVEINYNRLKKLIGGKADKKKIIDALPYLGLDIEGETNQGARIEYSPNRPDYSTDYGIAIGLQGLLGIKQGMVNLRIKNKENYSIKVDSSVSKVRPFVMGIIAKNGTIDDNMLKQLISMQEDLHFGIGRRRKKSSIGIHDLDRISFPLKYSAVTRKHKFIPLHSDKQTSIDEILANSDVGRDYRYILGNSPKVPLISDSENNTVSFPPIINAAITTVTTKTKNLFVEVTGITKDDIEDVLSIIGTILQSAGFELHAVKVSGAKNSSPLFKLRRLKIDSDLANKTLGIDLSPGKIAASLKKSRLDANIRGTKIECVIPRYRFDIFGPMDLVEEIALGYGIDNMEPVVSPPQTLGERHPESILLESIRATMTGLGYMEGLNSSLTSQRTLYENSGRDYSEMISVLDSKSLEHTILRDSLLPGLVDSFAKNIHEAYPQKLFELGTVFSNTGSISEHIHLCAASSHKDANFSELKSVLESVVYTIYGKTCQTKAALHDSFERGRTADIELGGKTIGMIGEISKLTKQSLRLREPIAAFEIKLPG